MVGGGNKQLVAVDDQGSVKGYSVSKSVKQLEIEVESEEKITSDEVVELNKKKIELQNKLQEIEEKKEAQKTQMSAPEHKKPPQEDDVTMSVAASLEKQNCELTMTVNKMGWVIRTAVLYSDSLFENGSHIAYQEASTNTVTVPLTKLKNTDEGIKIKILMGAGFHAPHFLIHNIPEYKLPKFAFLSPLTAAQ